MVLTHSSSWHCRPGAPTRLVSSGWHQFSLAYIQVSPAAGTEFLQQTHTHTEDREWADTETSLRKVLIRRCKKTDFSDQAQVSARHAYWLAPFYTLFWQFLLCSSVFLLSLHSISSVDTVLPIPSNNPDFQVCLLVCLQFLYYSSVSVTGQDCIWLLC